MRPAMINWILMGSGYPGSGACGYFGSVKLGPVHAKNPLGRGSNTISRHASLATRGAFPLRFPLP